MDMSALDPVFAQKLAKFIRYNPGTGHHDAERARELSRKFYVSTRDLNDWAAGMAAAPPMMKKQISEYLEANKDRV